MKKIWMFARFLLVIGMVLLVVMPVFAQDVEYRLNINRTFGYSSGNQIKGSFKLDVVPTTDVKSVRYLIDGEEIGKVNQAPFSFAISTTNYPYGMHEISAEVEKTDGTKVMTAARTFEFATAEQESQAVTSIIFPILGVVVAAVVIMLGVQWLMMRRGGQINHKLPMGAERNFGFSGGGICPRCKRATTLHMWGLNAGFRTKFDRCDNCGMWAFIKIEPRSVLDEAIAAELKDTESDRGKVAEKTEEEKMRDLINQSRYSK